MISNGSDPAPSPLAGVTMIETQYTLPVGTAVFTMGTPGPSDKRFQHIGSIPTLADPGWPYVARIDGSPIIIATAKTDVILAQSQDTAVVGEIVDAFNARGATILDIAMCIMYARAELASAFLDCASSAMLRCVWTANSFESHRIPRANGAQNFVLFRRAR